MSELSRRSVLSAANALGAAIISPGGAAPTANKFDPRSAELDRLFEALRLANAREEYLDEFIPKSDEETRALEEASRRARALRERLEDELILWADELYLSDNMSGNDVVLRCRIAEYWLMRQGYGGGENYYHALRELVRAVQVMTGTPPSSRKPLRVYSVIDLVQHFSGREAFAALLSVPAAAVSRWERTNKIPEELQVRVYAELERHDVSIGAYFIPTILPKMNPFGAAYR